MKKELLLGNEAIAVGAIHSGISAAYGYPGTPSTEIMETLLKYNNPKNPLHLSWCCNEKTAYETALGMSMAGKRVLVTMKHVGLNVAADPFINSSFLKINGGLVVVVADDPGMHSSQNEQDSRFYADFSHILCFEPASQQEAYCMVKECFKISERLNIPVLMRIVTRLAHSRSIVKISDSVNKIRSSGKIDTQGWLALPSIAKKLINELHHKQQKMLNYSNGSDFNFLKINSEFRKYGVITSGQAMNYYAAYRDELPSEPSHLHIGIYPIPIKQVQQLAGQVEKIFVLEEGYPFIERLLRGVLSQKIEIAGKLSGEIPIMGELTPDIVRSSLSLHPKKILLKASLNCPVRPPRLCDGCPHIDSFLVLKEVIKNFPDTVVTSDIGCYSLGALPPFSILNSIVCMGASIGMARGVAEGGNHPVIAVIGDSTFFHSGVTALIDAIKANPNMTVIILDNNVVAMTGGQLTVFLPNKLHTLILALGVPSEHLKRFVPLKKNFTENVKILREEVAYKGLSVILSERPCVKFLKRN